mmetsp:Transcript_22748/g.54458  ORF Transcript_22748/g.54458 Transcript_22748/m.54458 type:complete len:100 (+) Transcript_22748:168-467(+)
MWRIHVRDRLNDDKHPPPLLLSRSSALEGGPFPLSSPAAQTARATQTRSPSPASDRVPQQGPQWQQREPQRAIVCPRTALQRRTVFCFSHGRPSETAVD